MKRFYLLYILASALMLATGCESEPAEVLQAEPDYAYVELSLSVAYRSVPTHTYDEEYILLESEEEYYTIQAEIEAALEVLNVNNEQK